MTEVQPDTEQLLRLTAQGDRGARGALLQRHRDRLRRMVALRLDRRLAARVDPSDVVQETLAEADRRLDDYARRPPLPFYPWLRQIAGEQLVNQFRRHVRAQRRSVRREEPEGLGLSDQSYEELADQLLAPGEAPSATFQRREQHQRVRAALEQLTAGDREVLVLRYLEQLSARDVAAVLGIRESAAKKRALRALQRLRGLLLDEGAGAQ